MSDMKSAYERAMERVEKLGKASPEEMQRMEAVPIGNKLAAQYMKEPDFNLDGELAKYKGTGIRKQIIEGVMEILLRHIALPATPGAKAAIDRAKRGILSIKENKRAVENVFTQLDNLFNYYDQARQQTFNQLKQALEQRVAQQMRASGQLGAQPKIDVTAQPEFQQEWARVLADLNARYDQALEEQKQRIAEAP